MPEIYKPSGREFWQLLKETFAEWQKDRCLELGAALAYYTLFSIAPLLLITIALTALFFGERLASGELMASIEQAAGAEAAKAIRGMVERASAPRSGIIATLSGLVMTLFGASSVFGQLQSSLNIIWDAPPRTGKGFTAVLWARLSSFSMILVIGFLLLVSLAIGSAIGVFSATLSSWIPGGDLLARGIDVAVSFATTTLLFAMMFRILPDIRIPWTDVWIGAAFTSVLFAVGRLGISFYLGHSSASSVYGAASSLVVVLLWIYYSSQLLFFGAEFTQVYARRFGSLRGSSAGASVQP